MCVFFFSFFPGRPPVWIALLQAFVKLSAQATAEHSTSGTASGAGELARPTLSVDTLDGSGKVYFR